MVIINKLIEYWLSTYWIVALFMSAVVNTVIFICTAFVLDKLIQKFVGLNIGTYIDNREYKNNQKKIEIKNGILACIIFAFGSLLVREFYTGIWPSSFTNLFVQLLFFTLFYETYSYVIHRFLHTKFLSKFHFIHHSSIRVTPWSAYSVHPIEALFIGLSVPLYMVLFPLNLGIALSFHVIGMMFTILIHSNFSFNSKNMILKVINKYSYFHSQHHMHGKVNFGFVNQFLDKLLKTKKQ